MEAHLGDVIGELPPMQPRRPCPTPFDSVAKIKAALFAVSGAIIVCIVVLMAFLLAMASASRVRAHDAAQWIQDGNYKNAAGELCCGIKDCVELSDDQVKVTPYGYEVTLMAKAMDGMPLVRYETVPFSEATPSPDGKYWRCQWGGARKCFFAPPSQT